MCCQDGSIIVSSRLHETRCLSIGTNAPHHNGEATIRICRTREIWHTKYFLLLTRLLLLASLRHGMFTIYSDLTTASNPWYNWTTTLHNNHVSLPRQGSSNSGKLGDGLFHFWSFRCVGTTHRTSPAALGVTHAQPETNDPMRARGIQVATR